jgi:hypothetical protein
MVIEQDEQGRDLKAELKVDGVEWRLFVDIETGIAVIRKKFSGGLSTAVGKWQLPPLFDAYETCLKNFIESCAQERCNHSKSEHESESGGTGRCRHEDDVKKHCECKHFKPR